MHGPIRNFELDLSFTGIPETSISPAVDKKTKSLLTKATAWNGSLKKWLLTIRNDLNFFCPKVVRIAPEISLGLQFTDDDTIAKLNSIWRKKSEVTDVLSFPVLEKDIILANNQCLELGDIVLSVPTAEKQAMEHSHGLEQELRWLVSHGLLHLLGWDHPNKFRLKEMLNAQEQLLRINGMFYSPKT